MMATSANIVPLLNETVQLQRLMSLGTSNAGVIHVYMVAGGARVETAAKRNASGSIVNVRTGNLRSSIHTAIEVRGNLLVVQVNCDAAYALAVHEGQKAHTVVPTRARVLSWQGAGGPVFAMSARHPGTKGRPFLREAIPAFSNV